MSNEKEIPLNPIQVALSQVLNTDSTNEQLLDLYLALPRKLRDIHFVDTASAAEIVGVSQRTIQLWIDNGALRSVVIGKKYKVSIASLKEYLNNQRNKKTIR